MTRRLLPLLVLGLAAMLPLAFSRAEEEPSPPAFAAAVRTHPAPWKLCASADGSRLYVACGAKRYVAEIDVPRRRVLRRIATDGIPRAMAVSPDGATLAVTFSDLDAVGLVDLATGEVGRLLRTGRAPEGVAFTPDGGRLFVANRLSEDVSVVDVASGQEKARLASGREAYALSMSPDGKTVAVASRRVSVTAPDAVPVTEVTLIDVLTTEVRARVMLDSCHMIDACAFTTDSERVLVPAVRVRNLLPIVQVARGWVLSTVLASIDASSGAYALLPLQYVNEGFADPTGIAVNDNGRRAYVASGGLDEIAVIDVTVLRGMEVKARPDVPERSALTKEYVLRRVRVGDNPRGVAWLGRGPDGAVAVANHLDDDVMLLNRQGDLVARVPLEAPIPDDALHRGRRAFFDANYCFQRTFSCTSCHPEGHTDGLTYDFEIDGVGRNPVLNRSLLGLAGTAPYKWIGINPSIQRQCGARFAMVLTRANPFPPDVLADMETYLLSLPPPLPTLDAKTDDVVLRASIDRGRALFGRSRRKDGTRLGPTQRCVTCHPPPLYTNKQVTDVGTTGPLDDHERYDTPHLTGTGSKAPYLHDGRAFTLEDIFRTLGDRHGYVSDLTVEEMRDLVAYLRSL